MKTFYKRMYCGIPEKDCLYVYERRKRLLDGSFHLLIYAMNKFQGRNFKYISQCTKANVEVISVNILWRTYVLHASLSFLFNNQGTCVLSKNMHLPKRNNVNQYPLLLYHCLPVRLLSTLLNSVAAAVLPISSSSTSVININQCLLRCYHYLPVRLIS